MLTPCHMKYISKDSLLGYCTTWDREFILMFQMKCCLHLQGTSSNHILYLLYQYGISAKCHTHRECCMLSLDTQ